MTQCIIKLIIALGLLVSFYLPVDGQSLDATIESYFKEHEPPLRYKAKKEGWWELRFEAEFLNAIVLWVQTPTDGAGNQFVSFWSIIDDIPPEILQDKKRLEKLYQVLLEIGRDYYIVKAIIDQDNDIGIQAELHADNLNSDTFLTTLWMVVDCTNKESKNILKLLEVAK